MFLVMVSSLFLGSGDGQPGVCVTMPISLRELLLMKNFPFDSMIVESSWGLIPL